MNFLENTVSFSLLLGDDSTWIKTAFWNCKQLFMSPNMKCLCSVLFPQAPCSHCTQSTVQSNFKVICFLLFFSVFFSFPF